MFLDESLYLNVETKTIVQAASLPIETFPFAMPTIADIENKVVYTVDWCKFKVLKYQDDKWNQIANLKNM